MTLSLNDAKEEYKFSLWRQNHSISKHMFVLDFVRE